MYSLGSGVGAYLADHIRTKLGLQTRVLRPGNLARAMSFCVSPADRALALDCGHLGGQALIAGLGSQRGEYLSMERHGQYVARCLTRLPSGKRTLEPGYYDSAQFNITDAFRQYASAFTADIPELFGTELKPIKTNPVLNSA